MTNNFPEADMRGLRPVDAPDVFVPAPDFPWTGLAAIILTLATVAIPVGLTVLSAVLTLLLTFLFLPLGLIGVALTISFVCAAVSKLTFGIVVCVYSLKGKPAAPYLGVGFAIFSFLALGLMIQLVEHARTSAGSESLPLTETLIYLLICLALTLGLLAVAARDLWRSKRFRRLYRLGDRLTLSDLELAGLVDGMPRANLPDRELEFQDGQPNAYGSHRGP